MSAEDWANQERCQRAADLASAGFIHVTGLPVADLDKRDEFFTEVDGALDVLRGGGELSKVPIAPADGTIQAIADHCGHWDRESGVTVAVTVDGEI